MPAIGIITFSETFLTMPKTDGEKADGVIATSEAIPLTSSFTYPNMVWNSVIREGIMYSLRCSSNSCHTLSKISLLFLLPA